MALQLFQYIFWKDFSFLIELFWCCCLNLIGFNSVDLFLVSLFCSFDLFVPCYILVPVFIVIRNKILRVWSSFLVGFFRREVWDGEGRKEKRYWKVSHMFKRKMWDWRWNDWFFEEAITELGEHLYTFFSFSSLQIVLNERGQKGLYWSMVTRVF